VEDGEFEVPDPELLEPDVPELPEPEFEGEELP
jgi:hypothetical protein